MQNLISQSMRTRLVVCAAAALVGGLAILLKADAEEQHAALVRDGHAGHSPSMLASRMDQTPAVAVTRQVFLLRVEGKHEEALRLLVGYADARPQDRRAQEELFAMLQVQGDEARATNVAERLMRSWGSPSAFNFLIAQYRRAGDRERELATLRRAAFVGQIEMHDLERLGLIEASLGSTEAAIQHLSDVDATRKGLSRSGELALLDLLLSAGNTRMAVRRAERWKRQSQDASALADYCVAFALAGHPDAGAALARSPAGSTDQLGHCAGILADAGELRLAGNVLNMRLGHHDDGMAPDRASSEAAGESAGPGGADTAPPPCPACLRPEWLSPH